MFEANSRYYKLSTLTYTGSDGRQIPYVERRFLPRGRDLQVLVEVTVAEGDRLDLIAHRTLGAAEAGWWVSDANDAMHPEELLEEPGEKIHVPVPRL